MVNAMHDAVILASLTPKGQAQFRKKCETCGANPGTWCEKRIGTICEGRGNLKEGA